MSRRISRIRGIVSLWIIFVFIGVFAFLGLAIDMGYVVLTAQQLQVGADAASLAAVQSVRLDPNLAQRDAIDFAALNVAGGQHLQLRNAGNGVNSDIILGVWDPATRVFTATLDEPNAVQITARRNDSGLNGPLDLLFSPAFGINQANLERTSIAYQPARDIVLVLDYSASMNDDSSLDDNDENIERNLRRSWQLLGSPTYGTMSFDPVEIDDPASHSFILNRLGLNGLPYPYPQGSWAEFVAYADGVGANVNGVTRVIDPAYRDMYGVMTLIDYWNNARPEFDATPDLWQTDVQPITAVKDAVSVFLNYIRQGNSTDHVGLVAYTHSNNNFAHLEQPLTDNLLLVEDRSRMMQAGHYNRFTNIGAGIWEAIVELDNNQRPGTNKLIVLLSDGVANLPSNESEGRRHARRMANRAARRSYPIATISLGANADNTLMADISNRTGGVPFRVEGSVGEVEDELIEVFTEIAADRAIQLVQ